MSLRVRDRPTPCYMCDLGPVTYNLRVSLSSPVQWVSPSKASCEDCLTHQKCSVQHLGHGKCSLDDSCTYHSLDRLNIGTGIKRGSVQGSNWWLAHELHETGVSPSRY